VIARHQFDLPFARIEIDAAQQEQVEMIRHWLRARDIELAGEFAEWHAEPVHAFLAGKRAAERVEDALEQKLRPAILPRPAVAHLVATQSSTRS
jgi:hypothetical protein